MSVAIIYSCSKKPWVWGLLVTVLIVGLAVWAASLPACYETISGYTTCSTKLFYLKQSTPNELGDSLAGFAGALALVWIVVTVAMQSLELRAQREELSFTRYEMVEQKEALQRSAAEAEHARFTAELNTHLMIVATLIGVSPLKLRFRDDNDKSEYKTFAGRAFDSRVDDIHTYLRETSYTYQGLHGKINAFCLEEEISRFLGYKQSYCDVLNLLNWVFDNKNKMDKSQKAVLNACRIMDLRDGIEKLLENCTWMENPNPRELMRLE